MLRKGKQKRVDVNMRERCVVEIYGGKEKEIKRKWFEIDLLNQGE